MRRSGVLSLAFFLALLSCSAWAFSEDAQQPGYRETIQGLSQQVHEQLDGLREQSRSLTEQLRIAENELALSSAQVSELQTELTDLNSCLENTNRKLADYSTKLTVYETKLKEKQRQIRKMTFFLVVLIATLFLVRVALAVLKLKFGIKVPYWINLIL